MFRVVKTLDTLVDDVYGLFDQTVDHVPSEENLDTFCNNLKETLRKSLAKQPETREALRFSALGKQDRQIWYEAHPDGNKEEMSNQTLYKFLYGHIIEELVLFLAKEAGHTVEREQEEVEIDGVLGHIDAIVDGVVVDVKSASPFGYKKFKEGTIEENDPFGYVNQLAGYATILTPNERAAWIAVDKVSGAICVTYLSSTSISENPPADRIEKLREVIASETPPERCYSDVEDGKSGNRKLTTGCSYCAHKKRCWPGLRSFSYSTGPRYLTQVMKTPDVREYDV
jgi:hypothetical protein